MHPQIFVTDMERAVRFYRDRLGFTVEYLYGEPPYYGLVVRDAAAINLRRVDRLPLDETLRDRESLLAATLIVRNLKALFVRFKDADLVVHQPYREQPWNEASTSGVREGPQPVGAIGHACAGQELAEASPRSSVDAHDGPASGTPADELVARGGRAESGKSMVLLRRNRPAGSIVAFSDHLPHYSAKNRSAESRHAFSMHFAERGAAWSKLNWLQRPRLGEYLLD